MAHMQELFAELFAYVLLFEQTHLQGEFQPSYEQVRRDLAGLLDRHKAEARRLGISDQDDTEACFAVVAWADETILKHTAWKHHHDWAILPLQLEYFRTRNAGEEFFQHLDRLRVEQREVREIYYLCLGLGFTGRYFLGAEDERMLNSIRHEQAGLLPSPVANLQQLEKITPQPYAVQPPVGKPIQRPLTHLLLPVGVALLILIPLGVWLTYQFSGTPPPRPLPTEKTTQPLPLPSETPQPQSLPADPPCSKITTQLQDGVVVLGGRVASEGLQAELRRTWQNRKGITKVNDAALRIIPQPFCEVLDIVDMINQQGNAQSFDLTLGLQKRGSEPVYFKDEPLVVLVKAAPQFTGYVYIDYYTADKTVGHILPNPLEPTNRLTSGKWRTVGQPGNAQKNEWVISEPFGLELVTVIASKTPLFAGLRDNDTEPAEPYMQELRRIVSKSPAKLEAAATHSFFRTQAR